MYYYIFPKAQMGSASNKDTYLGKFVKNESKLTNYHVFLLQLLNRPIGKYRSSRQNISKLEAAIHFNRRNRAVVLCAMLRSMSINSMAWISSKSKLHNILEPLDMLQSSLSLGRLFCSIKKKLYNSILVVQLAQLTTYNRFCKRLS